LSRDEIPDFARFHKLQLAGSLFPDSIKAYARES